MSQIFAGNYWTFVTTHLIKNAMKKMKVDQLG